MKKFIIKYGKDSDHAIYEVEIEKDKAPDLWGKGNWQAYIIAPTSLYEKSKKDGKMHPPHWYNHAFYDTLDEAKQKFKEDIELSITVDKSKLAKSYIKATEQEVEESIQSLKIVLLS